MVVVVSLHLSACGLPNPFASDARGCNPRAAAACSRDRDSPNSIECRWVRAFDDTTGATLADLVGARDADLDAAARALFPALAGKALADDVLAPPASVTYDGFGAYPPYTVTFPIDWTADPYGNNSWRLYFQTLHWIDGYSKDDVDVSAAIVVDWADHALRANPRLEFTWHDAGIARRLDRVSDFITRYAASRDVLDRRVVHAAADIVVTHMYALGADSCYNDRNNHGVMQDISLIDSALRYPAVADSERLFDRAQTRLLRHVDAEVTPEGIHVENSPEYQVLYLNLMSRAIDVYATAGAAVPPALTGARDGMLAALVHQLRPDLTLPQFGDTSNTAHTALLLRLIDDARAQSGRTAPAYDQLEWVLTGGAAGSTPDAVDRVFIDGGYAAFRTGWDVDPADTIAAHFTCNRDSMAHYHKDETSFEIFGFGQALMIDAGKYTYDADDPLVIHQYGVNAHNVLTVDHRQSKPNGTPRIINHGATAEVAWVQGVHDNFAHRGVTSQARTFAHVKPRTFVVVDHVRAQGFHKYVQHFHLASNLSRVTQTATGYTATTADGRGPTVVITPHQVPTGHRELRGLNTPEITQGWQFGAWSVADPASNIVFRYERDDAELDFPVIITVSGPGERPIEPTGIAYLEGDGVMTVTWRVDGQRQRLTLPLPNAAPGSLNPPPQRPALPTWSPAEGGFDLEVELAQTP